MENLEDLNVVIASHIYATGPVLDLEEYLKSKVNTLMFIGHPFSYRKENNSFYRKYSQGKLKREHKTNAFQMPEIIFYLKDAFYTLWWTMTYDQKIDLFIGSDNSMAFLGLIAKYLGKVEDVVLYTIDYMPQRFKNPLFNSLYHFFDKQCLMHCKAIWNVSPKMTQARKEFHHMNTDYYTPQIIVPLGMWYNRIHRLVPDKKDASTIIFMGHILEKQGLDVVIKALPLISKKIPDIKLLVIGAGSYLENVKELVSKLRVNKIVEFKGFLENHKDVEKILAVGTVAVATYKPDPESFTYFADPGKIKNYLAAGLPVFLTAVPPIAKEIEKEKCAIICEYNEEDVARKIIRLLSNKVRLKRYSLNAIQFAKQFNWNEIFPKALSRTYGFSD